MDCQHIRTAIDTASRFEPMGENAQHHLRSCNGCREYADEMSSFLSLLKSTPRVVAPADFDFRLRARIAEAQAKRRNPFLFPGRLAVSVVLLGTKLPRRWQRLRWWRR